MTSPTPPPALRALNALIHTPAFLLQCYNLYVSHRVLTRKSTAPRSRISFDHMFAYMNGFLLIYQAVNLIMSVGLLSYDQTTVIWRLFFMISDFTYFAVTFVYAGFVIRRYGKVYAVLNKSFGKRLFPALQVLTIVVWGCIGPTAVIFDIVATVQVSRGGSVPEWEPTGSNDNGVVLTFMWNLYVLVIDVVVSSLLYFRLRGAMGDRQGLLPGFGKGGIGTASGVVRSTSVVGSGQPAWTPDASTYLSLSQLNQSSTDALLGPGAETATLWIDTSTTIPIPEPSLLRTSTSNLHLPHTSPPTPPLRPPTTPTPRKSALRCLTTLHKKRDTTLLLRQSTYGVALLIMVSLVGALFALIATLVLYDPNNPYAYGYRILTELSWSIPVYHARFAWIYVRAVKKLTKGLR